jgi:hypothetical protein
MNVLINSISLGVAILFFSKCMYIIDCTKGLCDRRIFHVRFKISTYYTMLFHSHVLLV